MICRTAVEIVCRSVDVPISSVERIGLGVHTLFCGPCRRFRGQIQRFHRLCDAAEESTPPALALSPDARTRIAAALEQPG